MNQKVFIYAGFMLIGTFISSIAQVLLKKEAERPHESIIREYLNPRVIIAYIIFFAATLLGIYAYKVIPLSMGAILEATNYIYVTVFGAVFFKEKISGMKLIALALILAGIAVYAGFG